jgi:hypothetical protein
MPSLALRRAGVPAKYCVRRAPSNRPSCQRDNAEPSPDTDVAGGGQAKKGYTQNNTCYAVDTAHIGFHTNSFKLSRLETCILGIFVHVPNEKHNKPHRHAQHESDDRDAHQTVVGGKKIG